MPLAPVIGAVTVVQLSQPPVPPDWSSKLSASMVASAERSRGGFGVATTGDESALPPWPFVALTVYRYEVPLTTLVSTYSGWARPVAIVVAGPPAASARLTV